MPLPIGRAELRLLKVFATVVECGGFSAAQVALNVGQSTISTQMADLEARLGTRLCRRGRAGFGLTDNGRAVYEASQRLFSALDAFSAEVGGLRGRLVGDLHIGVLDNTISNPDCRLHEVIRHFKERAPAVHLNLHIAPPLEIERAVLDGRYHIGISSFSAHAPGLDYHVLFDERMDLYCGRGHPLFERADDDLPVEEIERAEYVRRGYATAASTGRLAPRNVTATAYNMEAAAEMILSGAFIGHLPSHYAGRWVAWRLMRPLRPDLLGFSSVFETVVRKGPPRMAAIGIFLGELDRLFGVTRDGGRRARAAASAEASSGA